MKVRNVTPGADDILRRELSNGMVVLARENPVSQTVAVSACIRGGDILNPPDKGGLSGLHAMLLSTGTARRDHAAISEALESIGASIGFSSGTHALNMTSRCLAEDFETVLGLAAEMLREPSFPENKLSQYRDQAIAALRYRAHDTGEMAQELFLKLFYDDHPYADSGVGTIQSLSALTRADIAAHHQNVISPRGMILSISGGIEPERALDTVLKIFGGWDCAPLIREPAYPYASGPSASVRDVYEIAGMSQMNYVIGFDAPGINDPDYNAVRLGNSVFGQFGMMGRLGDVVRDRNGLAYSIGSGLRTRPLGNVWAIQAGVNPGNLERAIELTLSEARRYLAEPVSAEELADVLSFSNGVMPLVLESNRGICEAMVGIERYGLGLDHYREIGGKLARISAEEILEASRKYMNLDRMAVASAGTPAQES